MPILETTFGEDNTAIDIAFTYENEAGAGVPLVYVHEWGCSGDDFKGAASAVGLKNRPRLSFDYPGHGESSVPSRGLTVDNLAEIMHDVILAAGIDYFAIVGHSLGGMVMMRYAMRHPTGIAGLVNIVGNMRPEDCFLTDDVASGRVLKQDMIAKYRRSGNPGFRRYAEGLTRVDERTFVSLAASVVDACADASAYRHFTDPASDTPRLFVYGSEAIATLPYLDELRANPVIEVHEVPDADHFPAVDNPRNFYGAIGSFMSDIDPQV